jgi:hypothetical protein
MKPKRYIVWSTNEIDLGDQFQRNWYIQPVMSSGRAEDVPLLDWQEVRTLLLHLDLPASIRALWEHYYSSTP